ncbi:carbon storage regulator [Helicobacter pylori]|uniref:carbon storage regulator n=1 Tax=Helicobacter pylori TaxID=210 RepID=UPI0002B9A720|nr:carbon storage regulator [Helicobacter pylori]EMH42827.1 carbon storage regulator [Helicobacter pylori GAM93Bi]MCQ2968463.1 carbon storage regulator [Helicobacter pylori]OOQ22027.1 carbon storage regulator [Helicobacter pylori]PDX04654.1 carbon storage regulator [Helicobacter pylori]
MLILSRKVNEGIVIDDNIHIKVISIDRGSVRLGFEAPESTLILRTELKETIVSENQKASASVDESLLENIKKVIKP